MKSCRRGTVVALAVVVSVALCGCSSKHVIDRPADNAACMRCHAERTLSTTRNGVAVPLNIDTNRMSESAHNILPCTACHQCYDGDARPHRTSTQLVSCLPCHNKLFRFHPGVKDDVDGTPPGGDASRRCKECHGTHYVG